MPKSFRVMTKNVYITITNILDNFETSDSDKFVQELFHIDKLETLPYFVWEDSGKSNKHLHALFNFSKSESVTRNTFKPLLERFKSKSLNI